MDYLKAIDKRISRRTYLGTPIDTQKIAILINLINKINKETGLSIAFIEDGSNAFRSLSKSYGMFQGVRSLIVLKGSTGVKDLKEKLGYYGEEIVLEATNLNLGTCWVGGTFDRKNPVFQVDGKEKLVCVITIGNVAEDKSIREKMIYGLTHRKTRSMEEFYTADKAVPDWFRNGIKAVQKAPSATNSQKYRFEYKNDVVKAFIPDNYEYDLVDLGIAKFHFELAAGGKFCVGNHGVYSPRS